MSYTLSTISPTDRRGMAQLCTLLEGEGIALDRNLDYTCGLFDEDYQLVATGSTFGNTLRCFAVSSQHQGEGLLNEIVSHLIERQAALGRTHLFVYTKQSSSKFFSSLGFYEIAKVGKTLSFLENRKDGFSSFLHGLSPFYQEGKQAAAIVMNANPFTLGHQYLVEQAAKAYDLVHLFVLSEDAGPIPASVRWRLVQAGVAHLPNVVCHQTGPYLISTATFPSYFLKEEIQVIEHHAQLDVALFIQIARVLGISARFVGEEPSSLVTGRYNQVMARELPKAGIQVVELPRKQEGDTWISASTVRKAIQQGKLEQLAGLVPDTTLEFFQSKAGESVVKAIQACADVIHY